MQSIKVHLAEVPVEDHAANGAAEVAVREIKRQIRAMLADLQERLGFEVKSRLLYDVVTTPRGIFIDPFSGWIGRRDAVRAHLRKKLEDPFGSDQNSHEMAGSTN